LIDAIGLGHVWSALSLLRWPAAFVLLCAAELAAQLVAADGVTVDYGPLRKSDPPGESTL
jgi:hypothetical protein